MIDFIVANYVRLWKLAKSVNGLENVMRTPMQIKGKDTTVLSRSFAIRKIILEAWAPMI